MNKSLFWMTLTAVCCFSFPASATTYSVTATTYNWIDAGSHTKIGPTTGGSYSTLYKFTDPGGCGTAPPVIDDTISDNIPLGFTFTFGSVAFTSVRIMSNGRIQFNNNTTCGFGSPVTQLPYPDASLTYSMRIYGNDLDPSLQSEISGYTTPCKSRSSCYISYSTIGSAPNRSFVVTYNNIPEWTATNTASGSYNLQIILQENGQFIYQYGSDTPGPQATLAQTGWEISTTDYAVSGTGFPANNTALLFYIPNSGTVVQPGAFNAFDTSTWLGSTTGVIQTKIAGNVFSLDVVALTNAPSSVQTTFNGSVKVELVDTTSASSCAAMAAIQTVASSYTYVSSDLGRHTFSGISQAQAYPNVQVRISYPPVSPTLVVCSTDQFAIRPNNFAVVASDTDWTTAGNSRILNSSTTTGAPTHKAGQPLSLTVTPYNSLGAVTSAYNGAPVASTTCAIPVSNCVSGSFNSGSFTLSGGVATSVTASYSDVGVVNLTLSDATFAKIDVSDGTSPSQLTISSPPITVGRFVPDHFDATLNTPLFSPACGTFTYMGQPMKYAVNPVANIMAKNAAGITTQNYTGALFKIIPSGSSYGISPIYTEASKSVSVLNALAPVAVDNGNGAGTLTFADTVSNILGIVRSNNPINVFNADIGMSFTLQDTDNIQVGNVNGVSAGNPVYFGKATTGNGIGFSGGNNAQKWGRLSINNANGSELTALTAPLTTQYYNGMAFVTNTGDNCTSLNLGSMFSLSNPSTNNGATQLGTANMIIGSGTTKASLINTPLAAGSTGLSFSPPGTGNTGYINIISDFSTLPWLLFNWNQNGSNNTSPTAVVTFGVYQGNPKVIYFREVY